MLVEERLAKERKKAFGDLLINECKASEPNYAAINALIENGADVTYQNAKCLMWASKRLDYKLIKFLVRSGVLECKVAINYIADTCNKKGFTDEKEAEFFEVLDEIKRTSDVDYLAIFTPYINAQAVSGKIEKLRKLMARYYLTEAEIVSCIYTRIIFEVVLHEHEEVLKLINAHNKWMNEENFNLAVRTGDWVTLEYMLEKGVYFTPEETAISAAVMGGFFEVLDLLIANGFTFGEKPIFLKKACRAVFGETGLTAVKYLFEHGYTQNSRYDGADVRANAVKDDNVVLLEFLENYALGEKRYDEHKFIQLEKTEYVAPNEITKPQETEGELTLDFSNHDLPYVSADANVVSNEYSNELKSVIDGSVFDDEYPAPHDNYQAERELDDEDETDETDETETDETDDEIYDETAKAEGNSAQNKPVRDYSNLQIERLETKYEFTPDDELMIKVNENEPEALAELGSRLVDSDDERALHYVFFAMQLGYAPACRIAGELYLRSGDVEKAVSAYKQGKRSGDKKANLAWVETCIYDEKEAFDEAVRLAQGGNARAMKVLSDYYFNAGNETEGAYWKRKAKKFGK